MVLQTRPMQVRLLLGPAGSGKTFRCLTETREALSGAPEGLPLFLLAPKQTTYQLERELLAGGSIQGYTRLHILSFERLAHHIFEMLKRAAPDLLDEDGRLMVLRAILAKKKNELKLFRASARLTGFARQLSQVLHEFQRSRLTPQSLNELASKMEGTVGLASKLQDLATLFQHYLDWLAEHGLQDAESLLESAAKAIAERAGTLAGSASEICMGGLWAEGVSQIS